MTTKKKQGAYKMAKRSGLRALSFICSISAAGVFLFLAGCGGTDGTVATETVSQSITECYSCHADGLIAKYAGENHFSAWINGPHGNYEGLYHADNGKDNEGFPNYGYHGLGTSPDCTTQCHDQLGDGMLLEDFYLETGIDFLGRVNRPLIGCESCHGTGEDHYGAGPIPYPDPGPEICGQCHNDTFDHNEHHPEGDHIYEDYQDSAHSHSINDHVYAEESTTDVRAKCSKCHTDEGGRLYRNVSGGYSELGELIPSDAPAIANATAVQCSTCHDAHNPDELLLGAVTDALGSTVTSAEYRTCTNCHQTVDGYHGENSSHSWSGGQVGVGTFDTSRIIYDTHFDDGATTDIEGYVLDPSRDRVCRDCHNQHSANLDINRAWANSAHGGHILQTIDPVQGVAMVTEAEGPAWVHYDFKGANRQACQRCHTSTGFMNLAADPEGYDPADNEFTATGEQREMLYCWACHTSNAGDIRDPGVFNSTAPYDAPADRIAGVPDIGGSNVCMACHSGRESGQSIKDSTDDFTDKGFVNSHYLAAGGVLYRTAGYEFDGMTYENTSYFIHDHIGTALAMETGANGPCAGCHMRTDEGHLLLPVKKDAGGHITEITAYGQTCSRCHGYEEGLLEDLNELEEGFGAALEALRTALEGKGFVFLGGYPYFSNTDWTTVEDPTGKDNMGAAFNFNFLLHEPGAYVHNLQYTRKLIYDSIDFLDDGLLNGSVESTLGPGAAYDFLAGARP